MLQPDDHPARHAEDTTSPRHELGQQPVFFIFGESAGKSFFSEEILHNLLRASVPVSTAGGGKSVDRGAGLAAADPEADPAFVVEVKRPPDAKPTDLN